ncbi:MAG: hypothetical protein AAGA70_09335 [Pseudomonadota bacterium]
MLWTIEYHPFLSDEAGAVTVDWGAVTAAVVGIGPATLGVVSSGVGRSANETAGRSADAPLELSFFRSQALASFDVANGLGGWNGGTAANLFGVRDVLQLDGGETAQLQRSVPGGATEAPISFDLIADDNLDDDPAAVMNNGKVVSIYADDHGNVSVNGDAVDGISVSVDHQAINDPLGAGSDGRDSVSTFTITVNDPGSTLALGVSSGADEPKGSEFYAFDNVSVVSQ